MKVNANPRVLHVAETLPGGIATYLNEIIPWQIRQFGAGRVALVCPEQHLDHLSVLSRNGLVLMPYSRTGRNLSSLFRAWGRYQRALGEWAPDLVHAHSSFAGGLCRLPGRRGPPVIYCPHGWSFDREDSRLANLLYGTLEKRLQGRTAAIVAISNYEKSSAERVGIAGERVKVIRYGLDPSRLLPGERAGPQQGPLELLFIGRLDRQKGLDWLLEVLRSVPPDRVRLTVLGGSVLGSRNHPAQLPNVVFTGWVHADQIDSHIDACDAVIMPSRWEGFGLVAAEAMRRSVPVLVSNRGALTEVIGGNEAGRVFALEKPDQLRTLLLGLDRSELRRLGAAGRERFRQFFTNERMNTETLALYQQILGRP